MKKLKTSLLCGGTSDRRLAAIASALLLGEASLARRTFSLAGGPVVQHIVLEYPATNRRFVLLPQDVKRLRRAGVIPD